MFSLYLMRLGGGIYVAYITSRSGFDATFVQLRGNQKRGFNKTTKNKVYVKRKGKLPGLVIVTLTSLSET